MELAVRQYLHLLYLGTQGIRDQKESIKDYRYDEIFRIARKNALSSFVNMVLENNGIENKAFQNARNTVLAHHLKLTEEEKALKEYLAEHRFAFATLKGMSYQDIYPGFATREVADLDILIERKSRRKAGRFLEKRRYTRCHTNDAEYHDTYCKGILTIELHYALLLHGLTKAWDRFAGSVYKSMKHCSKVSGEYHGLTPEEQYIYLIAHAYRHFVLWEGMGTRFLLDVWYFRKAFPDAASSETVRQVLKDMELDIYEQNAVELADMLFGIGIDQLKLTKEQEAEVVHYVNCLAGADEHKQGLILADPDAVKGRGWLYIFRYSLRQLDENPGWYVFHSPFAYRHKWARPPVLLYYSVRKVLQNPADTIARYGRTGGR